MSPWWVLIRGRSKLAKGQRLGARGWFAVRMLALKFLDKKTAQALVTVLVFGLALMFVYAAWRIILAFLFAIFFAYLFEAPVERLQKGLRGSRNAAITVVYLVFIAGLVLVLALAVPPAVQEAQSLMQRAPQLATQISEGDITRSEEHTS